MLFDVKKFDMPLTSWSGDYLYCHLIAGWELKMKTTIIVSLLVAFCASAQGEMKVYYKLHQKCWMNNMKLFLYYI